MAQTTIPPQYHCLCCFAGVAQICWINQRSVVSAKPTLPCSTPRNSVVAVLHDVPSRVKAHAMSYWRYFFRQGNALGVRKRNERDRELALGSRYGSSASELGSRALSPPAGFVARTLLVRRFPFALLCHCCRSCTLSSCSRGPASCGTSSFVA